MSSDSSARTYTGFLPILLVIIVLLGMAGSQIYDSLQQRDLLEQLISNQSEPLAETLRVREQFESLVAGTARLAASGNTEAQRIQAELERVGISFSADDDG